MNRRIFLAGFMSALALVTPSWAGSITDQYIAQLKSQGFGNLNVSRTWLGRTRITASSKTQSRELVFNGSTGEILRDFSEMKSGDDSATPLLTPEDAATSTASDASIEGHSVSSTSSTEGDSSGSGASGSGGASGAGGDGGNGGGSGEGSGGEGGSGGS